MFRAALPEAALERLRPMPVLEEDLDLAAARYADELPEHIDLVHLGLGPDGHTASLVPGDPVLEVRDRLVAVTAGEYQGRRRMTLTYPALEAARRIVWLVTGADKRDALAQLLGGDPSIPAGRVKARNALVICDRAAAPGAPL
jgi:6-phosphogluconolactonase